LGGLFNLTKQTISNYETGHSSPTPDQVREFAGFFGVSADYLLGVNEKAPEPPDDIAYLLRSTGELSEADRKQLLDFADWLRTRKKGVRPKT
jgi:transcriptional regulator with XRE-family HTH domain